MSSRMLRICYFGTYRAEYSRNQIMIAGLRQAGAEVVECHAVLWTDIADRVRLARGAWVQPAFWKRVLNAYFGLLRQYRVVGDYDILMVGYPGQFDVCLARLLAWVRRRPLVWDVFMSIYLIAVERQLDRGSHLTVGALRFIESLALRLPDRLIADTADYVAWYSHVHGLRTDRFRLVPTGADDRRYPPQAPIDPQSAGPLRVVYYGTFIPNHGLSYILEAARQLADEPRISFELIGDGPDRPSAREFVERFGLIHVAFVSWLEPTALAQRVGQAHVVLGAFGLTPQSLMTVQNKIYEGLALARAVVTGDSPAVRAALVVGEEIWAVDRHDPGSLAKALRALLADQALCALLAAAGYRRFVADYNIAAIGRQTSAHLQALWPASASSDPVASRLG
jgi:glycosyltransferase involved in cell wall biosynthesis